MYLYTTLLEIASFLGALCAGFIFAQSPRRRVTQLTALIALGGAWWTHCEASWNLAPDRETALLWMRLSTPGWAFIGALLAHLAYRSVEEYPTELLAWRRSLHRAMLAGYAAGGAILLLVWLDGWVHQDLQRVPWGWSYHPGVAQLLYFGVANTAALMALVGLATLFRSAASAAVRIQRLWIWTGILVPASVITVTDILLPFMRVPFPRLGSASYAVLGLVTLGTAIRYGFSLISPGRFSDEIIEAIEEGVVMASAAGVIRRANRGFARLIGHSRDGLIGRQLTSLLNSEASNGEGGGVARRGTLLHASGEHIPVSVSSPVLRDRRSNAVGLVVVVRDLREVEDLRRKMLVQARLAAVGELAAGLAHEMNNPLAFVRANLAMLERHWKTVTGCEECDRDDVTAVVAEGEELLHESITGIDRASEIIRSVRSFTHSGQAARELANVNELVEDALSMARLHFNSPGIVVEFHPADLPFVRCAPQELRQVFLNLFVNAAHALEGDGYIHVTTQAEANQVAIRIRDDGYGIPQEFLDRVFDPFFTTKQVGEGTGLGLSIAYQIIDSHGGEISVDSGPERGTEFCVRLPVEAGA